MRPEHPCGRTWKHVNGRLGSSLADLGNSSLMPKSPRGTHRYCVVECALTGKGVTLQTIRSDNGLSKPMRKDGMRSWFTG